MCGNIITIEELKAFLKIIGIDPTQYTDEELELILKILTSSLNTRLNGLLFGYNTTDHFQHNCSTKQYKCGETVKLKKYPVHHIINCNLPKETYIINNGAGIIEFTQSYNIKGFLKITYRVGFNDEQINRLILPLLWGLIEAYFNPSRNAVSITEGEVSISYGQSSLMDKALKDIDKITSMYTSKRLEMI